MDQQKNVPARLSFYVAHSTGTAPALIKSLFSVPFMV